jgi:hypothetical protein
MSKRPRKSSKLHSRASRKQLDKLRGAANRMKASRSRRRVYQFLSAVYRTYWLWSKRGTAQKRIKALASASSAPHRKHRHAFRTMLDTAGCSPEAKVLSRWTRALEYALDRDIRPSRLQQLFKHNGGIAGCARLAAQQLPKHESYRNDWL